MTTKRWKGEKLQRRDRQVAPLFRRVEIKTGAALYRLQGFKSVDTWKSCTRMTSALTSQEQQTARVYFQREGRGEKLLKVVSSKALSDVRPNYTLFLTTTQFYSRTLAWLPWLVHGHLSLIFPCPPPPPPPPPHCPTSSCPCPWKGHSPEEEEVKKGNVRLFFLV